MKKIYLRTIFALIATAGLSNTAIGASTSLNSTKTCNVIHDSQPADTYKEYLNSIYSRPKTFHRFSEGHYTILNKQELEILMKSAFGDLPIYHLSTRDIDYSRREAYGSYNTFTPLTGITNSKLEGHGLKVPKQDEDASIYGKNQKKWEMPFFIHRSQPFLTQIEDLYWLHLPMDRALQSFDVLNRQMKMYRLIENFGGPKVLGIGYSASNKLGIIVEKIIGQPLQDHSLSYPKLVDSLFNDLNNLMKHSLDQNYLPADLHRQNVWVIGTNLRFLEVSNIPFTKLPSGKAVTNNSLSSVGVDMLQRSLDTYLRLWLNTSAEVQQKTPLINPITSTIISALPAPIAESWMRKFQNPTEVKLEP